MSGDIGHPEAQPTDPNTSASRPRELQLRRVLFGGVNREDAAAQGEHLGRTQARLKDTRQALVEAAGWAGRLPVALADLARLAAGEADWQDPDGHFAAVVHEVAGRHLLAGVELVHVYSATPVECEQQTEWQAPGSPLTTSVRVGTRMLRCRWLAGIEAGSDTVAVVERLCCAVLFAFVGLDAAGEREQRGVLTQLGDERTLARHRALRERLGQPASELAVEIERESAGAHRTLFGEVAWQASFAEAGATLEEVAYRCGGQAYQLAGLTFALLIDRDRGEDAKTELDERLGGGELEFDVRLLG